MNTELNPYIYRMQSGKRRTLLTMLSWMTLRRIDFVHRFEQQLRARACDKIVEQLNTADLVMLRDPETLAAVESCGPVPGAIVGADPAEMLRPAAWERITLLPQERALLESDERKVGLCISAQRRLVHQEELIGFLDRLTESRHTIVFLPMNHRSDAELMRNLRERMTHRDRSVVVEGRRDPGEILAIAGRLDLVISSRLHLLILASLVHVPIIGISRGSKVDNFLAPFGHSSAGSVDRCDFDHMQRELDRLIDRRDEFMQVSAAVHEMLLERLDDAKKRLADVLEKSGIKQND